MSKKTVYAVLAAAFAIPIFFLIIDPQLAFSLSLLLVGALPIICHITEGDNYYID